MLITFKSKAAAEVLMYTVHAKPLLDLLRKDCARGVITAAEMPAAILILEADIAARQQAADDAQRALGQTEDDDAIDKHDPVAASNRVRLSTRAWPLMEMLRAAQRGQHDVMWGV